MEIKYKPRYVSDETFQRSNPAHLRVSGVYEVEQKAKNGKLFMSYELEVLDSDNVLERLGLWGANLQRMVLELGNDSDKWIGASFDLLHQETIDGKRIKVISNVRKA